VTTGHHGDVLRLALATRTCSPGGAAIAFKDQGDNVTLKERGNSRAYMTNVIAGLRRPKQTWRAISAVRSELASSVKMTSSIISCGIRRMCTAACAQRCTLA
jgi:hypothetical protein